MSLIPDEQLKKATSLNLAPMVDFLFVVIAVFATIAITRAVLYDTDVKLVRTKSDPAQAVQAPPYIINIGIGKDGTYKWITEVSEFVIENPEKIQKELQKQQQIGLISQNPEHTKVLLHIDQKAPWDSVAAIIFSLREQGFPVHPVYESVDPS